jgi:dynein heavy chain, axonemal
VRYSLIDFFPCDYLPCSKSIPADKQEEKNIFMCPVYKTEVRGPTFVFLAQLKTKSPSARWVMAGAALICDVAM